MGEYEHKKIIKELASLDKLPSEQNKIISWVKADDHIKFLNENARSPEIVICASTEYSLIQSIVVPEDLLKSLSQDGLMGESCDYGLDISVASYVSGEGKVAMRVERGAGAVGSKMLSKGTYLIYMRCLEGSNEKYGNYFEPLQEYIHLERLHWRAEKRGYCRYNENGDLVQMVSTTMRSSDNEIALATFDRSSLECYLAASEQVLVRFFRFILRDYNKCDNCIGVEKKFNLNSAEIFYKQQNYGLSADTEGTQIVRPSRTKKEIFAELEVRRLGVKNKNHVEFIAHDWRNCRLANISTDPKATTNHFKEKDNHLPWELSPAFFSSEVMLKYKGDKDKYIVGERGITCRDVWHLKLFDVNEAGQIFAYICYLRQLPESELLYWKSFNEKPLAPISKRALDNDFRGRSTPCIDSLKRIKDIAQLWKRKNYSWWKLEDNQLIDKVTVPYTLSLKDWGDSFLALTNLIHEGFVVKNLREILRQNKISFNAQEKSLALLETIINSCEKIKEPIKLIGLRTSQKIRSKTVHGAQNEAKKLSSEALSEHGTYTAHFQHVCKTIYDELKIIQSRMKYFSEND